MKKREDSADAAQPFPKGTGKPATRAFNAAGYTRFEELAGKSEAFLLKMHGVGPKAIRVIKQALADNNLPRLTP